MNLLCKPENIFINETATSQEEMFEKIAKVAVNSGIARSIEEVVTGLKQRESGGSTGFMEGFAIPHTKSSAVSEPGIIIFRLTEGVEWNSMDGEPAKFIISLLIPEKEAGTTHLSLLSALSRALMHRDVRDHLLHANCGEAICQVLKEAADM